MTHDDSTQERHDDFQVLNDTINTVKKSLLVAIVPLMLAGIVALIANNAEQKNLVRQVAVLNEQISMMNARFDIINEKVIIMWSGGNWSSKYHASPPDK